MVTDFVYLGSNISVENSVQKYISARINKAGNNYCSLHNIWESNVYSLNTKVRFFKSNVISVLLYYGSQSWRVNTNDMHKLDVFQTKCLRRIFNIFRPNKISNEDMYRRTNSLSISCQIKKRIMRPYLENVTKYHILTGKRLNHRPKTTLRRSIIAELSDMSLTLGEAQLIAQDRKRWRNDILGMKRISKWEQQTYQIHPCNTGTKNNTPQ